MSWCPKFSLREILIVVAFIGLGLAAMQTGGWLAGFAMCLSSMLVLALLIVALVGRDDWRVFSIGMVVPVIVYGALCVRLGEKELNLYQARLPSSQLLAAPYPAIKTRVWVHAVSGEYVRDFDPVKDQGRLTAGGGFVGGGSFGVTGGGGGGFGGGGFGGFRANMEILSERPDTRTYMTLGHVLFAMMLGYVGGKFAILVRRNQPLKESIDQA